MKIKTYLPIMADRHKITQTIAAFWDKISEGWQTIWGPHIHHGYYEEQQSLTPLEAQENLIEKLAIMLNIKPQERILDVGCGMGGSSIYLARHYQANMTGVTLSQKQVAIATELAQAKKIKNVVFKIDDALALSHVENNSFDIVWSLESCEQFYDKALFLQQAFRVLKPGGKLMLATWCSDQDEYEGTLAYAYRKLCLAFDLPYMPSMEYYRSQLEQWGFHIIQWSDWSKHVIKSWDIGLSLVSAYSFFQLLMMGGLRGWRFAKQVKLMRNAFHQEWVRYGVFVAEKNVSK